VKSTRRAVKMPIDIQNVLVCDAVDPSCVELLKSNGISVDYKLKLPKDVLVAEAKVRKGESLMRNEAVEKPLS
jgi:hypothetical protein